MSVVWTKYVRGGSVEPTYTYWCELCLWTSTSIFAMNIQSLLNPAPAHTRDISATAIDAVPDLRRRETRTSLGKFSRFGHISRHYTSVDSPDLETRESPNASTFKFFTATPSRVEEDYRLNWQTTLSCLYVFDEIDAYVEYPECHETHPVGYLFRCNLNNWLNPTRNFAYSLGLPSGTTRQTRQGGLINVRPLKNSLTGESVACIEHHSTCKHFQIQ